MFEVALSSWVILLFTLLENYDTRRPMSSKWRHKYRIPDRSILRRIGRFKDKKNYPCNYFKIVPIYLYLLLSVVTTILLGIDLSLDRVITNSVAKELLIILPLVIYGVYILYFLTLVIWWQIVDNREMRNFLKKKLD